MAVRFISQMLLAQCVRRKEHGAFIAVLEITSIVFKINLWGRDAPMGRCRHKMQSGYEWLHLPTQLLSQLRGHGPFEREARAVGKALLLLELTRRKTQPNVQPLVSSFVQHLISGFCPVR